MALIFQPLRKYADFQGRARRREYWLFWLLHMAILAGWAICAVAVVYLVFLTNAPSGALPFGIGFLVLGVMLVVSFLPGLALSVRRLHDSDKSGFLMLLHFLPLGVVVLFVLMLLDGTSGANRFGPDPKGAAQADF